MLIIHSGILGHRLAGILSEARIFLDPCSGSTSYQIKWAQIANGFVWWAVFLDNGVALGGPGVGAHPLALHLHAYVCGGDPTR